MKPRIRWIGGYWVCGRGSDRPHHCGYGSTPHAAWVDWKVRGDRE